MTGSLGRSIQRGQLGDVLQTVNLDATPEKNLYVGVFVVVVFDFVRYI